MILKTGSYFLLSLFSHSLASRWQPNSLTSGAQSGFLSSACIYMCVSVCACMHVEHWEEKDTSVSSRDSLSWPCWHFRLDEPLLGRPKHWRVFSSIPILYRLDSNSIAPAPINSSHQNYSQTLPSVLWEGQNPPWSWEPLLYPVVFNPSCCQSNTSQRRGW